VGWLVIVQHNEACAFAMLGQFAGQYGDSQASKEKSQVYAEVCCL
jgi:hypothetical protein